MNHDQCSELLLPFLRHELSGREERDVRAHLEGCPACREEHESLRALVGGEQAP